MNNGEDLGLSRKRPVLVVPYSIIFGSVALNGDCIISEEVLKIMDSVRDDGYYILVDSHIGLAEASASLRENNIPYNGITFDQQKGQMHDEERYGERVDFHCGWDSVAVVIDEDIVRLKLAVELGASAIQIQSGCIIGQTSSGKSQTRVAAYKDAYSAAGASI